ncbi:YadA-like family protein [Psychrobacter maritimus]|uniref:YadA-like family protein n=1 Tax=Psychrobacter maritimus TaxID=256325 RepID=UPI0035643840
MNRSYKVIWNKSLKCFMAVSEYAKSRGKSSSRTVSASAPVSADAATGGTQLLRLSALCVGLAAAGMSLSPQVFAAASTGGTGSGTVISSCTGTTQANSGTVEQNIAIGCSSYTNNVGAQVADRKNPYYTNDTTAANTVPNADRNPFTPGNGQSAGSVAIGTGARTEQPLSLAIGEYARATDVAGIALGVGSLSKGNTALSIGRQSAAVADYAQAIGNVAAAAGKGSLAIGHSATASGYRAIAIGSPDIENAPPVAGQTGASYQTIGQTKASAKDSIAFGGGAQATAENALSIGAFSKATGGKSVAIGTGAEATQQNSVVIGDGSKTNVQGGVAIGKGAQVTGENSVAVGLNSLAVAQAGSSFLTNVAATTQGTVSFGNDAIKRRLTDLADGAIDSDAVTVAQLKKQNLLSNKQGEDTAAALGGASTYNPVTGAVTLPKYSVDGKEVTNVGAAITNIDGRTTTNSNNITNLQKQTFKIQANNDAATAVGADATVSFKDGKNIKVNRNGNDITIGTADDINVNSVTTGNTVINNAGITITEGSKVTKVSSSGTNVTDGTNTSNYGAIGLTITGGPSVTTTGINAGNQKITNVDNGSVLTGSKDAINGGQLFDSAESVKNVIGGNTVNNGGLITSTDIGGTGADTVHGAISNVKNAATAAKTIVTEGENILVTETVDQTTGASSYEVKTKRDLDLDSVTAKDANGNITKLTATGTNVTHGTNTSNYGATGLTITGGPSVTTAGINAGDKVITGVADAVDATDAVNKGQLDNLADGAVQYERDPITNAINYNKVILAGTPAVIGKDANGNNIVISGGTSLGNVANGVNASDAVNKGQLDSAQNALTNAGLSFAGDSGANVKRKLGETLSITGGAKAPLTTGNIGVVANGKDGLLVQLAKDIDLGADGSVKIGNTVTNNEGVKVDDGKGNSTTITTAGTNVVDDEGNSADYTATGSELADKDGNTNVSTAKGNTITNGDNVTTITGKGTNVVDNATGNSADYGANGFIATDTAGNTTIFNQGGVSFIDGTGMQTGPSISVGGINAGGTVITNVGDAVNATDAVNKGQLDKVTAEANGKTDALGNSTANNLGGGATYDPDTGKVSAPSYSLDNGSVNANNVGDALTNLDDRITSNTDNIADLAAGKAGLVQQQTPTDSITVGAATGGTSVDFTGKDGDRVLTGVANGTVAAGSNDVVTGDQLNNSADSIVGVIGGNAKNEGGVITTTDIGGTGKNTIDDAIASLKDGENASNDNIQANTDRLDAGLSFSADNGADINKPIGDGTALKFEGSDNITTTTTGSGIKFDLSGNISVDSVTTGNTTVNNNGVSIKDGPSMTVDGIYAGNKTITGVADGIEVNDAVNLGQLNALDQRVSNSVNELGYKIGEVEDGANAGISAAMAMSSLPQAYIPGKSMIGGGVGTYNGQSAVAVGISRVSDNGRWVIKANGTADTQGNAGGAIGAGFHF